VVDRNGFCEFVKGDNVRGNKASGNADVFWVRQVGAQIEARQIKRREVGVFRNHAVEQDFQSFQVSRYCRCVIRILDPIPANRQASSKLDRTIIVPFFNTHWVYVGDQFIGRDVLKNDRPNRAGCE
jgi:hypothetical protein